MIESHYFLCSIFKNEILFAVWLTIQDKNVHLYILFFFIVSNWCWQVYELNVCFSSVAWARAHMLLVVSETLSDYTATGVSHYSQNIELK